MSVSPTTSLALVAVVFCCRCSDDTRHMFGLTMSISRTSVFLRHT